MVVIFPSGSTFAGRVRAGVLIPGSAAAGTAAIKDDAILVQGIRVACNITVIKAYVIACVETVRVASLINLFMGILAAGIFRVGSTAAIIAAAASPTAAFAITFTHLNDSPLYKVVL